jgi:hypothetical protein
MNRRRDKKVAAVLIVFPPVLLFVIHPAIQPIIQVAAHLEAMCANPFIEINIRKRFLTY